MSTKKILKVREVSELLGVGLSTVYRAIGNGQLPAVRIGKAVRVRRETLERFLSEQENRVLGNPSA